MSTRDQKLKALRSIGVSIPLSVRRDWERPIPGAATQKWSWWAYLWERPSGSKSEAQRLWDTSEQFVKDQPDPLLVVERGRAAASLARREERKAEKEAEQLEVLTSKLRTGYFTVPGATEKAFQQALPDLLERLRIEAAISEASKTP